MASAAGYQIAREKYQAQAAQAGLQAEIRRQEVLQAELQRSQHTQQALEAQISRSQAEAQTRIAQEKLRFYESDFAQSKVHILLQGFNAISSIFHNIAWMAALVMGYTSQMFNKERTDLTGTALSYVFWAVGLTTLMMLVHAIFVSTLSLTDATKLAYQGTQGMDDLRRAFHGLMKRRSEVFWNFMAGFALFNVCVILTVWVKLDTREGLGDYIGRDAVIYGIAVTACYVAVPVVRMVCSFRSIRSEFRVRGSGQGDLASNLIQRHGRTGADVSELDLVPESVRRKYDQQKQRDGVPRTGEQAGAWASAQQQPPPFSAAAAAAAAAGPDFDGGDRTGYHHPEHTAAAGGGAFPATPDPDDLGQQGDALQGSGYQDPSEWMRGMSAGTGDFSQGAPSGANGGGGVTSGSASATQRVGEDGLPEAMRRDLWTPDRHSSTCTACRQPFAAFRRKHHCRACGEVFCHDCCKHQILMRRAGRRGKSYQRVCGQCRGDLLQRTATKERAEFMDDRSSADGSAYS